jgi:predicted RNA-binding Zn-ribbon protein involved in translation (DUF1610 family)
MGRPRFFCENCGAEVPRNAKSCPRCGRFFASIKCPSCGFTGEAGLFSGGCPVCGYSAPSRKNGEPPAETSVKKETGVLPVWVYIVTLLALLAVGVLFFRMR